MTVSTNSVIYIYNFILPNKSNMFFLLLTHLPVHYFARPEGGAIFFALYGYYMAYTNSLFFKKPQNIFRWFLPHWLTPRTKGRANFWRAQKQTWPPHESAKTPADRL